MGASQALTDYRAPLDAPAFELLNRFPALDGASRVLSSRAFGLAFGLVALVWLVLALRRRALGPALAALAAVGLSDRLGAELLKPWFHRLRPCFALAAGTFRQVLPASNVGSLPSLHAANAFAFSLAVSLSLPRAAPWLYAAACGIALSRVTGGVHWPTDVLAGAAFGTLVGALASATERLVARRRRAAIRAGG